MSIISNSLFAKTRVTFLHSPPLCAVRRPAQDIKRFPHSVCSGHLSAFQISQKQYGGRGKMRAGETKDESEREMEINVRKRRLDPTDCM